MPHLHGAVDVSFFTAEAETPVPDDEPNMLSLLSDDPALLTALLTYGDKNGLDEFSIMVDGLDSEPFGPFPPLVVATAWEMVLTVLDGHATFVGLDGPVWPHLRTQLPAAQALILEGLAEGWTGDAESLWFASLEAAGLPTQPMPRRRFTPREAPSEVSPVKRVANARDLAGRVMATLAPAFEGSLEISYYRRAGGERVRVFSPEDERAALLLHQLLPPKALDAFHLDVKVGLVESRLAGTLSRYCELNAGVKVKRPRGVHSSRRAQPFSADDGQWEWLSNPLSKAQRSWLEKNGPSWRGNADDLLPASLEHSPKTPPKRR